MNNTFLTLSLLVTAVSGGLVGSVVTKMSVDAQVSCVLPPVSVTAPVPDNGMQNLLKPTNIPLNGYRRY